MGKAKRAAAWGLSLAIVATVAVIAATLWQDVVRHML